MHATLFLVGKAASVFVFGVSLPCLVYFLSFCTKNGLGGRVMDQANYSACRPRSSASHSSCCSVWSFSDKLGRRKKMANQKALLFFPVFLYPITFLCPSINFLSPKKKPFRLCKNHFLENMSTTNLAKLPRQLRETTTSSPFVLHSDIHDNVLVDSFESRYARNPCLFPSPNGSHSSAESN